MYVRTCFSLAPHGCVQGHIDVGGLAAYEGDAWHAGDDLLQHLATGTGGQGTQSGTLVGGHKAGRREREGGRERGGGERGRGGGRGGEGRGGREGMGGKRERGRREERRRGGKRDGGDQGGRRGERDRCYVKTLL